MKIINSNQSHRIKTVKNLLDKNAPTNTLKEKSDLDIPKKNMDQVAFSKEALAYSTMESRVNGGEMLSGQFLVDKGTAANTTVQVSRSAFDKILHATTYGEPKWEECGNDGNKKWVVVNGQRFEVPLSAAEKAKMKDRQKTLLDYIVESEEKIKEDDKEKINAGEKLSGNIEALKNNKEVMALLEKLFVLS